MPTITVEQLSKIISNASVLTASEKQEWLRLVEFMNDKQLWDLYTILVPEAERQKQEVSAGRMPLAKSAAGLTRLPVAGKSASLNVASVEDKLVVKQAPILPSLATNNSVQAAKPVAGEGAPLSSFLQKKMGEAKAPNAQTSKPQPISSTPAPARTVPPPQPQNISSPATSSSNLNPPQTEISVVQDEHASVPASLAPEKVVSSVDSLEEVPGVGVATLRAMGMEKLSAQLAALVKHKGYFEVMFVFEKSPLYSAYVHTGLKLIQSGSDFESLSNTKSLDFKVFVTRQEFEAIADMLHGLGAR